MDGMKEHGWGSKQIDNGQRQRERGHHVKDEECRMGICVYVSYNAEEPNAELLICCYMTVSYTFVFLYINLLNNSE
jgi:hypothetical protein